MVKRALYILLGCLLTTSLAIAADNDGRTPQKARRNLEVAAVPTPVADERLIALVIGNGSYANSPLKNPVNDAKDVAAKLRRLGFDVIERNNMTTRQIGRTLAEFRSKLSAGAVALVFYAGHGLQINGENYLPAVDADISVEEDVPNQSLSVRQIMSVLDGAKTRLNLVFLDACRNNPYSRSFRSAEGGLARVTAPSGTLISYATRPGSVAADGAGRNGLYTSKLLAQMDTNLQIEQALKRVVSAVKEASQGRQEPWMEGSIEGDFCFGTCAGGSSSSASAAAVPDSAAIELAYWNSIKDSKDIGDYEAYLSQYPNGSFSNLAASRINVLQAAVSVAPSSTSGAVATTASPTDERRLALEQELARRQDALRQAKEMLGTTTGFLGLTVGASITKAQEQKIEELKKEIASLSDDSKRVRTDTMPNAADSGTPLPAPSPKQKRY